MSKLKLPKLSVVLPVYNAGNYLKNAIDSILNQTFTDFEVLIINDKSTDNSKQIIIDYIKNDTRIHFIDNPKNMGPAATRNIGLELSKGEFIALMDADDIANPTRFEKQLAIFNEHPEIGVCASWFTIFGKKNEVIKHPILHKNIKIEMLKGCCVGNPTAMIRKNSLQNIRYNPTYNCSEDYDLWSRLITKTQFYTIPESLLNYRWHETNISQTKIKEEIKNNIKIKTQMLSQFDISENDIRIPSFLNVLNYKKGLQPDQVIEVIDCGTYLLNQNKLLNNYDQYILEQFVDKSLLKTIRKAGSFSKHFLKYLIVKQPKIYSKLSAYDKIRIKIKCVFT